MKEQLQYLPTRTTSHCMSRVKLDSEFLTFDEIEMNKGKRLFTTTTLLF